MAEIWLDEVKKGSPEADALARKILTALADAWAWDHQIKGKAVVYKIDEESGSCNESRRSP